MDQMTQISIFELMDEYETPEIPLKEQKKGVKGWVIQIEGIYLRKNGWPGDWTGVETRPVIFTGNTHKDRDGFWWQSVQSTKGPFFGWTKGPERVFKARPTWNDCLKYVRENRQDHPEEVRYRSRDGDWNEICSYAEGY